MTELEIKQSICDIGHRMWQLGFVAANDGNISVKLDNDTFLTTPTGVSKSVLTPDMIIKVNTDGDVLETSGGFKPSSEFKMHLRCYKERPDITAVVHAHPPTATGFAVAHIPLDDYSMSEAVTFLGSVPVAPYATPSTDEVPESIAPFLASHDAILMGNHGALTVGIDLTQAYFRMETLEHFAKVSLVARQLGGAVELTKPQIDACCEIAKAFPIRHPGYKKYSK